MIHTLSSSHPLHFSNPHPILHILSLLSPQPPLQLLQKRTMPHPGFHNKIGDADFPAEKGRYILYASVSCPFVHRTLISHAMKGLEDVVQIVYLHPIQAHIGGVSSKRTWVFAGVEEDRPATVLAALEAFEKKDPSEIDEYLKQFIFNINSANTNQWGLLTADPLGHKTAKELYEKADPTFEGIWTVPVLFDTKTGKIVNNESAEICAIFDHAFDQWATNPSWTMHPAGIEVDAIKTRMDQDFQSIAVKGYGLMFAKENVTHYTGTKALEASLNTLEKHLETNRFVCGTQFTEADIRLVVVLLRMDPGTFPLSRVEYRIVSDFPVIHAYLRDIYQNVFNDNARQHWSAEQSCGLFWSYGQGIAPLPLNNLKQLQRPVDRVAIGK